MSHQSGIVGSKGLEQALSEVLSTDSIRLLKIAIENEELVEAGREAPSGDWQADYKALVPSAVEDKKPCYLLFRLDSTNSAGHDFVFIAWSPDFSHIREKMVYASTRATLKTLIGMQYIKQEIFATVPADISFEGYQKHVTAEAAPPPLTMAEIEKQEIRNAETRVEIGASTKHSLATGVHFPLSDEAMAKLRSLKDGGVTYVQLSIDTEAEVINLEQAGSQSADDVAALIPDNEPRYHLLNFKHNHEGDALQSMVFVYSCPGYKSSVKQRMLYSTCKAPLLDVVEQEIGLEMAKKLEIGEAAEFTTEFLYDQLHPAKTVFKQAFARPARPGKGGRRITRPRKDGEQDS